MGSQGRSPKAGRRDASPRIHPPGTDAGRVCQKALCKDAYKWSNKVGAGRTDNKRPRLHRCKANQAYTAFHGGKGAVRHGCRNKDTPSFKHGCLQVVEQSRCRTHRQQTTTVAQRQSHQSVLKGIGIINQKLISKTYFFYKLRAGSVTCPQFFCSFIYPMEALRHYAPKHYK